MAETTVASVAGAAPERVVAADLVRRALYVAPLFLLAAGLFWGRSGLLSTVFGLLLVVANFLVAARVSAWAARISLAVLMGAVLIGYVVRLACIGLATIAVHNASWFEPVPWGFTLVIAHLGLLTWEARHVSATLAFPTLRPKQARRGVAGLGPATVRSPKGL